jgi:Protein of unknown function (DUF3341)
MTAHIVLGAFESEAALTQAATYLRDLGFPIVETYTPSALIEARGSPLPAVMFAAGLVGAAAGLCLQIYAVTDWFNGSLWGLLGGGYGVDIGGRPNIFWPSFIPFVFETGLLFAMVAGFFGFILLNRLPRLYDPIDESDAFREASRDGWFLAIRTEDERVRDYAREVLHDLPAARIEELAG